MEKGITWTKEQLRKLAKKVDLLKEFDKAAADGDKDKMLEIIRKIRELNNE